jgi:hypothetical protein
VQQSPVAVPDEWCSPVSDSGGPAVGVEVAAQQRGELVGASVGTISTRSPAAVSTLATSDHGTARHSSYRRARTAKPCPFTTSLVGRSIRTTRTTVSTSTGDGADPGQRGHRDLGLGHGHEAEQRRQRPADRGGGRGQQVRVRVRVRREHATLPRDVREDGFIRR